MDPRWRMCPRAVSSSRSWTTTARRSPSAPQRSPGCSRARGSTTTTSFPGATRSTSRGLRPRLRARWCRSRRRATAPAGSQAVSDPASSGLSGIADPQDLGWSGLSGEVCGLTAALGDLRGDQLHERLERHVDLLARAVLDVDVHRLDLFASDHRDVRDLLQLRIADLAVEPLGALVDLHAHAGRAESRADLACVVVELVLDGCDDHLSWVQ